MQGWEKAFFSSLRVSVLVFQLELSTRAVPPSIQPLAVSLAASQPLLFAQHPAPSCSGLQT